MHKEISLSKALIVLLLITTAISGSGYLAINKFFNPKNDLRHCLNTIIQTGPQKEALKTSYLAELLNLAQDQPIPAARFDLKQAKEKLLSSPVIKAADVKLAAPQTVYVAYTVRQPVAALYDVVNGALDEEGFLFPLSPFFAPKTLPEIYLGLPDYVGLTWNQRLDVVHLPLALQLLGLLSTAPYADLFSVLRIDVSHATLGSFGTREIVLLIEEPYTLEKKKKIYLRLTPKNYVQELGNYLELRPKFLNASDKGLPSVIDLRIPKLAFIEELKAS